MNNIVYRVHNNKVQLGLKYNWPNEEIIDKITEYNKVIQTCHDDQLKNNCLYKAKYNQRYTSSPFKELKEVIDGDFIPKINYEIHDDMLFVFLPLFGKLTEEGLIYDQVDLDNFINNFLN